VMACRSAKKMDIAGLSPLMGLCLGRGLREWQCSGGVALADSGTRFIYRELARAYGFIDLGAEAEFTNAGKPLRRGHASGDDYRLLLEVAGIEGEAG
jgi:hypothetical protein